MYVRLQRLVMEAYSKILLWLLQANEASMGASHLHGSGARGLGVALLHDDLGYRILELAV